MKPSAQQAPGTSGSYDWAEHLIWMEGGESVQPSSAQTPATSNPWPGIVLAVAIAWLCMGLGAWAAQAGWSQARLLDPILVSMLVGMISGNLFAGSLFLPGLKIAVKGLLPLGVILLGARMDFVAALEIGVPGLLMSVLVVALALALLIGFRRQLGLSRDLACLLGVGTGICGGTAIVAIAPILAAKERDVILSVSLVTLIGLITMLILPFLGQWLELSQILYGMLAGLTIQQTPQVIAAGFAYGETAGQTATVAKLARVCLLAPVAVLIGWLATRQPGETGKRRPWYRLLPGFALGFLVLAIARSLGLIPEIEMAWAPAFLDAPASIHFDLSAVLKLCSTILLAAGMVGVGFQTNFGQFAELGWRPVLIATGASIIIGVTVLVILSAFFATPLDL